MAKIAILDDDTTFSALIKQFLEGRGHEVRCADSVPALLSTLKGNAPDLLVLDMQVPGGGGPTAGKLLQDDAALRRVPILLCSGMPIDQMQRWFPPRADRRYHLKPVDLDVLGRLAGELLGERAAPAASPSALPAAAAPGAAVRDEAPRTAAGSPVAALARLLQGELQRLALAKGEGAQEAAARIVDALLTEAIRLGASDIHIEPGRQSVAIRLRVDGILRDQGVFPRGSLSLAARLRVMANLAPSPPATASPEEGSFDVAVAEVFVRGRLSSFPSIYGDKIAVRLLRSDDQALSLESRGFLPPTLERLHGIIGRRSGMIFVSGLTGSGKTSTLCSILRAVAKREVNVMTLEDPVEYVIPGVVHTEIRSGSSFGFAEGVRALLRQDPDILMVGEIRDRETAETALRAAAAGHLVLASIHAADSAGVVGRLVGMGIEPFIVAQSLAACLAQRLVRKVCPGCAAPCAVEPRWLDAALAAALPAEAAAVRARLSGSASRLRAGRGCPSCYATGFSGRTGMFELTPVTPSIRAMILEGAPGRDLRAKAVEEGADTLLMDAAAKVAAGWTTAPEAFSAAL